jgi:hypothetical protein
MSLAYLCPGRRKLKSPNQEFVDRRSNLAGAGHSGNPADAGSQTRECDGSHMLRHALSCPFSRRERPVPRQQENGARREIGADGLAWEGHWDTHGWRGNEKWMERIVSLDDLGGADKQLSVMAIHDETTQPLFHEETKSVGIKRVDPPVHEAKAIRRADDGIAADLENRTTMDLDAWDIAAELFPSLC